VTLPTGNVMDVMHYRGRRNEAVTIMTGGGVVRMTVDNWLVVHAPFFPAPQLVLHDVRSALAREFSEVDW
jgi:hypothetical protein